MSTNNNESKENIINILKYMTIGIDTEKIEMSQYENSAEDKITLCNDGITLPFDPNDEDVVILKETATPNVGYEPDLIAMSMLIDEDDDEEEEITKDEEDEVSEEEIEEALDTIMTACLCGTILKHRSKRNRKYR